MHRRIDEDHHRYMTKLIPSVNKFYIRAGYNPRTLLRDFFVECIEGAIVVTV
jgi:hypothetical protein